MIISSRGITRDLVPSVFYDRGYDLLCEMIRENRELIPYSEQIYLYKAWPTVNERDLPKAITIEELKQTNLLLIRRIN